MLDCYLKSLSWVMITAFSHGRKPYHIGRILKNLHNPKLSQYQGGMNTDSLELLRGRAACCTLCES